MNIGKKLIVGALAVVGAWCAQAEEKCTDCITFSADKAFGIKLVKKGTPTAPSLEYSTDQLNWTKVTVDSDYAAKQDGDTYKIHFRGTDNKKLSESSSKYHAFTNTVGSAATAIACSGNVLTLLDYGKVAKGEEPTMNDYAFYYLFSGFAALTAAPALPATTLAKSCYRSMFLRCTSLTAAPALPATTLASSCYQGMFKSCTSLTAAPALPATTMTGYCYQSMFYRCTSLTAAPALPATTLAANCYQDMFYGCTSLTAAPALPATTLPESCYGTMFLNCSSLKVNTAAPGKEWKIAAAPGTGVTTWGKNMFTGTGGDVTGTPDLNTTYYIASAPKETDCITFSADKSFGIRLNKGTDTTTPTVKLEYSTDQLNWKTFNVDTGYDAAQDGETYKLHIRGKGNSKFAAGSVAMSAHCFTNTVGSTATAIACSGNVMTLLDYATVAKGEEPTMDRYAFACLFRGFAALTAAPALPATTLANYCYYSMFYNCTSLTAAPALPATTLAERCYFSMFNGCTSLTAAPALNATTLAEFCYSSMFYGCTSLTAAPALPATTLSERCYQNMFNGCTSLVVNKAAPGKEWKIPATTGEGATGWGTDMFKGTGGTLQDTPDLNKTYYIASAPKETDCITFSADKSFGIKLVGAGMSPPVPSLEYSTDQLNWTKVAVGTGYDAKQDGETYKIHFRGTGNKTFATGFVKSNLFKTTDSSAATAIACSGNALTLLDHATVAKGEEPTMEEFAFANLFSDFAALTSAPALPATTLAASCYYSMFYNCTSLTAAPALPATTLAADCYGYMFKGCTSLTTAPALPATTLAARCYGNMFSGCTALTSAPALPATTLANYCYQNMFNGCTSLVVNTAAPGKEWKIPATTGEGATNWGKDMFTGTGGDVTGTPALNTTYYVGAKKEVVGDVTLYRYGDQVGVSVAGELTKAMADSIKDQGITNLVVGTGVTGVGAGAFEGWRSLRDVTISTNCTAIGADAFHRCQNVTNVTVQADETVAVGDYAFYRCNSLEKLSFAHLPSWGETPFSFYSAIYMKDGIPEVYAIPTVEAGTAKQKLYGTNKLEGKSTEWTEIETEEQKTQFHFFKIALEM